jgi:hypothetical protein
MQNSEFRNLANFLQGQFASLEALKQSGSAVVNTAHPSARLTDPWSRGIPAHEVAVLHSTFREGYKPAERTHFTRYHHHL